MPECVSVKKFYSCIKEYMKRFRGTTDIELVQKAHYTAVRKCSKEVFEMEKGG